MAHFSCPEWNAFLAKNLLGDQATAFVLGKIILDMYVIKINK